MLISSVQEHAFPAGSEQCVADFAELVALALANAHARGEVAASRARIVEAGDAERRRVERNLHDGAQQRLVTLSLFLRLAERQLPDTAAPASAAEAALGLLDLGLGRPADALARLKGVLAEGHAAYRYAVIDDFVEAAVAAGRRDDALDAVAAWQRLSRHSGAATWEILLARAHALLAPAAEAEAQFRECLIVHEKLPWPFLHARTELAYGEFLRRARRKADARTQLRAALQRFEALGAAPWADRAAELRATGETARKRNASIIDQLTPQELQIARMVAEGARNRDIAGRLFLSPKTVEYHLRKILQKLEIGSRVELIRLVTSGDAPGELVEAV